jgi:catalase-peroxidase
MLTSDLGLRYDPIYHNISTTFWHDFDYFTEKFALAWCMLPTSVSCVVMEPELTCL